MVFRSEVSCLVSIASELRYLVRSTEEEETRAEGVARDFRSANDTNEDLDRCIFFSGTATCGKMYFAAGKGDIIRCIPMTGILSCER